MYLKKIKLTVLSLLVMGLFVGCSSNENASSKEVVATVNGQDITVEEFEQVYNIQKKSIEMLYGEEALTQEISEGVTFADQLKEDVLQQIIDVNIMYKEAEKEIKAATTFAGKLLDIEPVIREAVAAAAAEGRQDRHLPMRCTVVVGDKEDISFEDTSESNITDRSSTSDASCRQQQNPGRHHLQQQQLQQQQQQLLQQQMLQQQQEERIRNYPRYGRSEQQMQQQQMQQQPPPQQQYMQQQYMQQQQQQQQQLPFPPPLTATEMQQRLEEEWSERERQLKEQHKRHLQAVVTHEIEKVRYIYIYIYIFIYI